MSCSFALAVDPPVCPISAAGGQSKHKLINQCGKRLAFKVKSSNNSNYTVSTIGGFIDVGKTCDFVVKRVAGKPKADKLVFVFHEAEDSATDPMPIVEGPPKGEVYGETTVKLSAAE